MVKVCGGFVDKWKFECQCLVFDVVGCLIKGCKIIFVQVVGVNGSLSGCQGLGFIVYLFVKMLGNVVQSCFGCFDGVEFFGFVWC